MDSLNLSLNSQREIQFSVCWLVIQMGIIDLINILEGLPTPPVDMAFKSKIFLTIFHMCTQREPLGNYCQELYERYGDVYNDCLRSKVLPAIQEKQHDDVSMLQELVIRWARYKVYVSKLSSYFHYLDRYYTHRNRLPTLKAVGLNCFAKIICEEEMMKVRLKEAVISLINQERQGEEIDQTLLNNVLQVFVQLGNQDDDDKHNMEYYVNGFETAFLDGTADYYTRKASNWTKEEYAVKVEECLQKEKDRVSRYLHSSTEEKLLKTVQGVLNTVF
ncbi:hypothetical protein MKW92_001246 [Papaver armeniacum]|nr:hypothetical protein MKW92_001246 [Papaver armeniacum]